ncbi:hypothetical protein [Paenibacillus sp. S150]|uniref:hypothetical protein n=1 Tax=Paenibacillus sp. S150 TaxID=2749826 RepID=UPI001C55EBD5|nr:hypothetical protein [Paenibacillus sp. S150]MBW4082687.1 hypothetical protein [Paenibacillus sp. S150]
MKKVLYGFIAVFALAGIIVYGFVSAPKVIQVDREIEVMGYKEENPEFAQPVTLLFTGVFDGKSKSFLGGLTINGQEYRQCRLSPEFALATCVIDGVPSSVIGMVFASGDFKEWSLMIGPSYGYQSSYSELYSLLNEGDSTGSAGNIIMTLSDAGRDSALEDFHVLMERWQDKMASRNP